MSHLEGLQKIVIRVDSRLHLAGLPFALTQTFIKDNTFQNPKCEMLERLGKWYNNEPQSIRLYERTADKLVLPRGYLPAVLRTLKQEGVKFELRDATICPRLNEKFKSDSLLYPFQQKALADLLRYRTGVLESPTGSGKTNMLLSAIPHLKTRALIVVHTTELLKQTANRVQSWLGIAPGIIGAGEFALRPITVAMVQTLAKRDLQGSGLAGYFGAVLVDECHHSPAMTWARILEQLPARYKYGFSATAWRKDHLQFLIWRLIGNVSARISREEAQAAQRIVWPEFETVTTDYSYELTDPGKWGEMVSDLAADTCRNAQIEAEIRARIKQSSRALVLVDRIAHAETLAQQLADLKPVLLTGEIGATQRDLAMRLIRSGAQLTIGTVHILGEGVDVPGWDLLFLASPIAGGPRTLQAIGRVTRPATGKARATVVDFLDTKVPALVHAWKARQKLYAA